MNWQSTAITASLVRHAYKSMGPPSNKKKKAIEENFYKDPTSTHAAMYLGNGELVEEGAKGMKVREPSAKVYVVYRYNGKEAEKVSQKAANHMKSWSEKRWNIYPIPKVLGFPGLVLRSSHYGFFAKQRVVWMKRQLANKFSLSGLTGLFCSEACILFYQVAALEEKVPNPIKLDSNHTSPMKLHAYLGSKSAQDAGWENVGLTGENKEFKISPPFKLPESDGKMLS